MYFLGNGKLPLGFGFLQLYPYTPDFIKAGLAGKPHLGRDILVPTGTIGVAELNGRGEKANGVQGGLMYYFYPEGTTLQYTFMHLKQVLKEGAIKINDKVFITNNSGSATNYRHEHVDIWDLKNGARNPNRPDLFLNVDDPKYWSSQKANNMITQAPDGTWYIELEKTVLGINSQAFANAISKAGEPIKPGNKPSGKTYLGTFNESVLFNIEPKPIASAQPFGAPAPNVKMSKNAQQAVLPKKPKK